MEKSGNHIQKYHTIKWLIIFYTGLKTYFKPFLIIIFSVIGSSVDICTNSKEYKLVTIFGCQKTQFVRNFAY